MVKRFTKAGWISAVSVLATSAVLANGMPMWAQAASEPVLHMAPGITGALVNNFSPFQATVTPGANGFIYQPLYYADPVSSQDVAWLGNGYSWSSDKRTLTVTLRSGAKWNDGSAVTQNDVVFTYNMIKLYPVADHSGVWSAIDHVKAVGSNKVAFHFKSVNIPFMWNVLSVDIVPQKIWSKLGDPSKAVVTNPVGSGPYTVSKANAQVFLLQANPYYYAPVPVKQIEIDAFNDNNSATLALAKDELDWGGTFIPNITKVFANTPTHQYWNPAANITMLYTNLKNPLLAQLPVREAISYAIDRNALAQKAEDGFSSPASPSGLLLPSQKKWLNPSLAKEGYGSFTYNQAKAVSILQKAGFVKDSNGIFAKNGKELAFTLKVVPGWTDWNTTATLVADMLGQIGIKVTVDGEQVNAYVNDLTNKNYQLAISWTNAGPTPFYLLDNMLQTGVYWNVEQFSSPVVDKAFVDFEQALDPAQQVKDIQTVESVFAKQLPSIPLFYGVHWTEYTTTHFTGWPTAKNPYALPDPYEWPAPAEVVLNLKPVQ